MGLCKINSLPPTYLSVFHRIMYIVQRLLPCTLRWFLGPRGFSWLFSSLDFSLHERAVRELWESCEAVKTWNGKKEKPLVTLDLNLTFMQMPAVKRVKFIISKRTNSNLAITCLSAANVSTWVVKSGITWTTWPGSMLVFARMFLSTMIAKVLSCLTLLRQGSKLTFSFGSQLATNGKILVARL